MAVSRFGLFTPVAHLIGGSVVVNSQFDLGSKENTLVSDRNRIPAGQLLVANRFTEQSRLQ
jgi:hypothetical protein